MESNMITIEGDILKVDLKLCKLVLNGVGTYVFVKDIDKKYIYANQLVEELFKDRFDSVIGHTDDELFDLVTSSDIQKNDDEVLEFGQSIKEKEINIIKSTGEKKVYLSVKEPIYNQHKKIVGIMGVSTDISELHTLQSELKVQASTDSLTGLYNRRFFFDLARKTFSESKRHNKPLSIIMFDIDLFKKINDKYGHPIGDIIIQFIANQARSLLREEDIIARVGGEEFTILLPNTTIESANLIAEKIRLHIDLQHVTGKWIGMVEPKISLGVSSYTDEDSEFDEMYTRSDKALYKAKYSGRNKVCVAERV
jgi:diguanylate cyclase (GGDEF)-like protein/PAS domain S-box-containing protein